MSSSAPGLDSFSFDGARGVNLTRASPPVPTLGDTPFAKALVVDRDFVRPDDLPAGWLYYVTAGDAGSIVFGINPETGERRTWGHTLVWNLSADLLRFLLLYFDQIDVPCIPEIDAEPSPDEQYLVELGFIVRTRYPPLPTDHYIWAVDESLEEYGLAPLVAYTDRAEADQGTWSLLRRGRPSFDAVPERATLDVALYGALPAPASAVPFDDILEFRAHHLDDLTDLRLSIETLRQEALAADDLKSGVKLAYAKIERSVAVLDAAMARRRILPVRFSLETSFSLYDGLTLAATTSSLAAVGAPLTVAAMGGVAAAALRLQVRKRALPHVPHGIELAYTAGVASAFGKAGA